MALEGDKLLRTSLPSNAHVYLVRTAVPADLQQLRQLGSGHSDSDTLSKLIESRKVRVLSCRSSDPDAGMAEVVLAGMCNISTGAGIPEHRPWLVATTPELGRVLMAFAIGFSRATDSLGDSPRLVTAARKDTTHRSRADIVKSLGQVLDRLALEAGNTDMPSQNPQTGLMALGLSSHQFTRASQQLWKDFQIRMPTTALFSYPTLDAIAEYLYPTSAPSITSLPHTLANGNFQAVTVASASCALPGGISQVGQIAALLTSTREAISTIPIERWDLRVWYDPTPGTPGKMYTQYGGFLSDGVVQNFDSSFFGLPVGESRVMSPSQRLVLEHTAQALYVGGCTLADVKGKQIAVYGGSCHHDWERIHSRSTQTSSPYITTGVATSVLAG